MAERGAGRHGLRLVALLTALALLLCLSACGSADPVCGRYRCVGAEAEGLDVPEALLNGEPTVLSLTADGRGTLSRGGTEGSLSWTRSGDALSLNVGGTVYDAELEDDAILLALEPGLILRFAREEQAAPAETPGHGPWDWYGWWGVEASTGLMPETWRDCCACLEQRDFGPVLTLWDEDGAYDEPLAIVQMCWDGAEAVSESGWFLLESVGPGDWRVDPAGEELTLGGAYRSEDESFDFRIRLRPWGARWEGDGSRLPFRYTDWYLPLLEAGEPMPGRIG